jgi:hypothetical protein
MICRFFILGICFAWVTGCRIDRNISGETYRDSRKQYRNMIGWYHYFIRDPYDISVSFLPDSLLVKELNKGYFSEEELVQWYADKNIRISSYLAEVHRKKTAQEIKKYRKIKLSNRKIKSLLTGIKYYYYNFTQKDVLDQTTEFDPGIFYTEIYEKENLIEKNIDSLLFSKKYLASSHTEIPAALVKYLNVVFEDQKDQLIINNDSALYLKVKKFHLSFDEKSNAVLWFSNTMADKTIYISPKIIRVLIIQSFNIYDKQLLHKKWRKMLTEKQEKQYTIYTSWSDLIIKNTAFNNRLTVLLSFMLHHEMAHIYLAQHAFPEQNEVRCDCYALAYFRYNYASKLLYKGLGMYNSLLRTAIEYNKPELWGLSDTVSLIKRFNLMDSISVLPMNPRLCDSIALQYR